MTPAKIKRLREALGWSVSKAAGKFQVSRRQWQRWEESETNMMLIHKDRLEKLYNFTFGRAEQ